MLYFLCLGTIAVIAGTWIGIGLSNLYFYLRKRVRLYRVRKFLERDVQREMRRLDVGDNHYFTGRIFWR